MKQIRPLATYKRLNPKRYEILLIAVGNCKGLSAKQRENEIYYYHCFYESGLMNFSLSYEELKDTYEWRFFWRDEENKNNKCTVTEMGRLLLTGWHYGIEDFCKTVCRQLFNAWKYKQENSIEFNDLEFSEAVQYIRQNIGYFYHHESDLKVYLLEHFFKEPIKPFLPEPPKQLDTFYKALDFLKDIKERNLKRDPDHYYRYCNELENYVSYLEDTLENCYIDHLDFDEYTARQAKKGQEYLDEIGALEAEHKGRRAAVLLDESTVMKMLT